MVLPNEKHKNLSVDQSFVDTLGNINEQHNPELSEVMLEKALELKTIVTDPTYVGPRHRDILEAYREVAPQKDRYNQLLFKKFESKVIT